MEKEMSILRALEICGKCSDFTPRYPNLGSGSVCEHFLEFSDFKGDFLASYSAWKEFEKAPIAGYGCDKGYF